MALGADKTLTIRTKFEADASGFYKVLDKVNEKTHESQEEFRDMATSANRALETIGLGANAQVPRLQRMANSFQGLTGKIGQGIQGLNSFSKSLAPWNQVVNLAGKAIRFAGDGLDAYAKTSDEAAKKVARLKDGLSGLKQGFMEGVGAVTVGLIEPLGLVDEELKRIEDRVTRVRNKIRIGLGQDVGSLWKGDDETKDPAAALGSAFGGFRSTLRGTVDYWNTDGTSFIDSFTEGMKKTAAATKKSAEENARWVAEFKAMQAGNQGRNFTDTLGRVPWSASVETKDGHLGLGITTDDGRDAATRAALDNFNAQRAATEEELSRGSRFAESQGRRNESYLAELFGGLDEFDAYATAFGGLTTAVNSAMQAWISGSMSLGLAIKKGIGDALAGVASQLAIESLKHGLFALGSLAFLDFGGAARHGSAAAAFGAGAIAAAAAAKKLGSSVNAELAAQKESAKGGGSSSTSGTRSGSSSSGGGSGGDSGRPIVVVIGSAFDEMSPRQRALAAESGYRRAKAQMDE